MSWTMGHVCANVHTYIYIIYYLIFYDFMLCFFRFFAGQGQLCPDGRSAGPVSCVRKWNVRSVRNRRQRSSVSWRRSETFPGKLQTWELWDPKLFHVKLPIHVPTTRRIVDESCLKKGVPGCNASQMGTLRSKTVFVRLARPECNSHVVLKAK